MEELIINYNGISENKRIANIVTGVYLAGFTLYFSIIEGVAGRYGVLFYCALIGFVLAVMLILGNTLWLSGATLSIDSNAIKPNMPKQNKSAIAWTSVSGVNIGVSYVALSIDGGQKHRKLDLSSLRYDDVKTVKSKILEVCEYKNIPYQND
ncbi:MAG: hypothetical protein LBN74_04880 [Prevotella sp.]|jgi:hypothetical protein|nr:hypothetical protein [Prevotella sp.]